MKMLVICLLAIIVSTTGVFLCEGMAKQVFHVGFFCAVGVSSVLLIIGHFN